MEHVSMWLAVPSTTGLRLHKLHRQKRDLDLAHYNYWTRSLHS
jgi:hypothetical protein